jgi:peptidoglycan/LPS O-acetylase OafA/YrhL
MPALDGLRALAVLAVILYHAHLPPWLPGGFLGVEVFFVISGYLITSLLLKEWGRDQRVNLKVFWLRRARRLLPALFLLLAGVLTFAVVFLPEEVAGLRPAALAAATYISNWYLIFQHQSYFLTIGRPPLLQHLWSLAVEEQFYLIWPPLFFLLMRLLRRRTVMLAAIAAAVASAVLMVALYQPDADPSRVYYGTDTRAAGLLIGVALAFIWAPGRRTNLPSALLDAAGLLALAGLFFAFYRLNEFESFLYLGGFTAVSLASALVIATSVDGRSRLLPRLLGWGPLRWAGLRSYGIYLWHWPVFQVTRPQLDLPLDGLPLFALRMALTLGLVELSYRFVEIPVRTGALGRAWHNWRSASGVRRWRLAGNWTVVGALVLVYCGLLINNVAAAKPPPPPAYLSVEGVDTLNTRASSGASETDSQVAAAGRSQMGVAEDPPAAGASTPPGQAPTTVDSATITMPAGTAPASPAGSGTADAATPDAAAIVRSARTLFAQTTQTTQTAQTTPANSSRASTPASVFLPQFGAASSGATAATPDPLPAAPVPAFASPLAVPSATSAVIASAAGPAARNPLLRPSRQPQPPPGALAAPATPTAAALTPANCKECVFAIGDSVMVGAVPQLAAAVPHVRIDALLGRQVTPAIQILQERKAAGRLGDVVIVHLGTNGTFSARQFDEMMQVLQGERRVVFVNVKVPRVWEAPNNTVLTDGVKRYANAVLVDWSSASSAHPEWFWGDGIHLRPAGAKVYAAMIAAAVSAP